MRVFGLCLMILMAGAPKTLAWTSPAPDVVLYCTPALADGLRQVAARYTRSSDVAVHIFLAPPDGLLGLIRRRARDDVVVADAPTVDALAAAKLVRPDTVVALGRNPYVLVARAGAVLPAGASAADLLVTHPTIVPDPTTAASFDGAAVLRAAFPAASAPHLVGVSDTPSVIIRVRDDGQALGLVHLTEAAAPGIVKAASLPVAPAQVSAALVTNGQSRNAAALLAFMAGPVGAAILHSAGLETKG